MNKSIELLINKINSACRVYGNKRSFYGWFVKKNHQHFLDISVENKLEKFREIVKVNENPVGFFQRFKALFFRSKHNSSMLYYFDLMTETKKYGEQKIAKNLEYSFVEKLSSIISKFLNILDSSSELHQSLSTIKTNIDPLLVTLSPKGNDVFAKILETKKENKSLSTSIQELQESTKEREEAVAELQRRSDSRDVKTEENNQTLSDILERMSRRDKEIERLERTVQEQGGRHKSGMSFGG